MNPSTQVVALRQRIKQTGLVLVLISVLTLLVLIAGAVSFLPLASAPPTQQIAVSNGDIYVGAGPWCRWRL